jgi:hypothetical protein
VIFAAATLLCGCGGSQLPSGAPGLVAQSRAIAAQPDRGGSWMLPEAKSEDLLYVVGSDASYPLIVYVLSYPAGKPVGKIIHAVSGLCTDAHGNVYMTQSWYSASRILEYAHGGTKPIATLSDQYTGPAGCAIDPTTGNLAVQNTQAGTTLVYLHARGKPKAYHNFLFAPGSVTYDNKGNLFTFGASFRAHVDELPKNGATFVRIHIERALGVPMGIQWDGKYLALGQGTLNYNDGVIRQFTVKNNRGIFEGSTRLGTYASAFYIKGSKVASTEGDDGDVVNIYDYPNGGPPVRTISGVGEAGNLVVSAAP